MNRTELIQRFCEMVNEGLSEGKDLGMVAYDELHAQVSETGEKLLLDQLYQTYCQARDPDSFYNERIWEPNERFEQSYELLRLTFNPDEIESRERLLEIATSLKNEYDPSLFIIIGRFSRVLGPQRYDTSGQLKEFSFNPLEVTDNIVSALLGSYMKIQDPYWHPESFGAIGNVATLIQFRQGKGHGTALVEAFEREVETIAAAHGDKLQLIVLEAQTGSLGFWVKRGYRWPAGTRYFQPPLEFDPITGERLHDEVPELLMVKIWNDPAATYIDAKLLADVVRTMYQNWCLAKVTTYTPLAAKRATDYVFGKVFADFLASLPPEGKPVRLQGPPDV